MRRSNFTDGHRLIARVVLVALLNQWMALPAFAAAPHQQEEEPAPLPLASTVTAISGSTTTTFVDATLIGKEASELVGKWIRLFTPDAPAGFITQITAFDSATGQITLANQLSAGAIEVNDVYHLADSREVLLPTSVNPATIGPGSIGCKPKGTGSPDTITCLAIDTTGVDAGRGNDTVAVTSPTIVLVTKFGSDKKDNPSDEDKADATDEATALNLGEGNDRVVNDGTVVAAAIAVKSETPKSQPEESKKTETNAAAKAEPTAIGIDAGDGQNIVTNNGTVSTSATALLLARQLPDADNQKNADVKSEATATSTAIQSGDGGSFITNTGRLASRAIAIAAGIGISTSTESEKKAPPSSESPTPTAVKEKEKEKEADKSNDGEFTFKGDVKATATASGITTGSGNDRVTNTSEIIVTGFAVALDAGATQIKAKGSAGTAAQSEATSTAQGTVLGDGNDTLINTGSLTVDATSRAISLEIAITDKNNESPAPGTTKPGNGDAAKKPESPKELNSTVDGSAKATATASGISADAVEATSDSEPIFNLAKGTLTLGRETSETRAGGNDSVNNSGTIDVNATARALAGAGGITVDGSATGNATSTATATAVGVDLGGGNDTLTNSGTINAIADTVATAISIAVAQKATATTTPPAGETPKADEEKNTVAIKAAIDASATATSTATGITADGAPASETDKIVASINLTPELDFTRETRTTQATGNDSVTNSSVIGVLATSLTRAAAVGIAADGAATIKATSTAESTVQGIDLGNGNDTLTNTAAGQLNTTATATANALSLAVGFKTDQAAKAEIESAATVAATATARATGVSADSAKPDSTSTITLGVGGGQGLSLEVAKTTTLAGGNDGVTNNGSITTTASATTNALGIAMSSDGKATVDAKSAAEADAGGIDLGAGNDTVTNTGAISATANATAHAIGIAIGVKGGNDPPPTSGTDSSTSATPAATTPLPLVSTTNASAESSAAAIGISADGLLADTAWKVQLQIGGGPTFVVFDKTTTHASGNDEVTNSGTIYASAAAIARALDVSVKQDDAAAANVDSTAKATAAGIDLGAGNDRLTSTAGTVEATADATAFALSVALGVKSDSTAKSTAQSAAAAAVTAVARAVGISADALNADSTAGIRIQHLEGVLTVNAQVSETRAGGNDTVTNAASVTSTATATSREAGASFTVDGSTASKNTSTATAEAVGIDLGGGNDTLTSNTGDIVTNATATARTLALAIGVEGSSSGTAAPEKPAKTAADTKAAVDGSVTANATAIGLAADSVRADSTFAASLTLQGFRPQLDVEVAHTRPSGDDTVTNDGAITTNARASSVAIAAAMGIGGDVTVKSTSTANATAAGIDLGGGNDTLTNNGVVTTTAVAEAEAINATIVGKKSEGSTTPTRAKSSVDATATANAQATGLAADSTASDGALTVKLTVGDDLFSGAVFGLSVTDARASGNDSVTNTGQIEVRANATTLAAGIGLVAEGTSSVRTSSTADATATAIDLGAGADTLTNEGLLKASAISIASALSVAVTNKGRATSTEGFFAASEGLWKGGIESTATAFGIDGAGAAAKSTTVDVALNGIVGVDVRFEKLEDGVSADLNDKITNTGSIQVDAMSATASLNVSSSGEGFAGAVSDLESKALAAGIRGGQGDDVIENLGLARITSVFATAFTGGVTVSVSGKGVAVAVDTLWDSGTEAAATAIGLDGDGGILKSKTITFQADLGGGELAIEKKETGATGNDTITNEQVIAAFAITLVPSLGVAYEAKTGVAATVSTVETTAAATGIRGGGGDDDITNFGSLLAGASALAAAANIAIAKDGGAIAGGAIWDGGTKAEATAVGIDADGVSTSSKTLTLTVKGGGVTVVRETIEDAVTGAGNDTVKNFAAISANAAAESDTLAVAGTANGITAAVGESTAESTAAAIRGGAGNDSITNSAKLDANASSIARQLNVSVVTTTGLAGAGNNVFDGGTTAAAKATGIAGDGGSTNTFTRVIGTGKTETEVAATGNDSIENSGDIDANAEATTRALSVPVAIQGAAIGASTSTAEAVAAAIDIAGGADTVNNSGLLKSSANGTATTANIAYTNLGIAGVTDAVWDGGTKARADAAGITGAGESPKTVTNHGAIEATSNATTGSLGVAVAIQGVAAAVGTSTAIAGATGIQVGHAQDSVTNTGALTINANALAGTANVSVTTLGLAASVDSVWDGGTTATATARGIGDGGGSGTVINGGRIESNARANTGSATVSVAVEGVAAAIGTATAIADASAIAVGDDGANTLVNRGRLLSDALARAGTANVSVTMGGVTVAGNDVWDGGTEASAIARTITGGNGDDSVTNAGDVNATSLATTVSVPVSFAVTGVGVAIATSTATSQAAAIDAGLGNNTIVNRNAGLTDRTGKLVADATANAGQAAVAATSLGVAAASDAVWDGGTTADAAARGIRTSTGNDTIDNLGAIDATSTARAGSASIAVAVTGVAVAAANSTALSNAAAIDSGASSGVQGGADQDLIVNRGLLTVVANALAFSLPVAVTTAGVSVTGNSVWDGGTTAEAIAAGIAARAGDDTIENHAGITAGADAKSGSLTASVAVTGFAASVATSTAIADAAAIDAGDGADRVTNTGKLTANAKALAPTVQVAVTTAGVAATSDAVWDGGTKGEASARTIAAGDGADRVRNVGDVSAVSIADSASLGVSVSVAGVGASVATSTATSTATAIDLAAGDDTVVNMSGGQTDRTGKLIADATANAYAASVTVVPTGVAVSADAVWRGGTTANARAAGIDSGAGKDTVVNSAAMDVDSSAFTGSVGAAITVFGVAAAIVNSTATASGAGIKTGDNIRSANGDPIDPDLDTESDFVSNSGGLIVDVDAWATAAAIGFAFGGVAGGATGLWDGGTVANADAWGIGLGNGADEVWNSGVIDIASIANTAAVSFVISVFGVAAAASTATANARSAALDGGDGNDIITNLAGATLTSDATATSVGVNATFTAIGAAVAGDTVWNGGTKANVVATGAGGGLGSDTITNDGTIAAKADSTTTSVAVSVSGIGVGGATATSTSTGTAMAIDGGDGVDTLVNRGNATATALSTARGIAVTAVGVGAGAAFDSFFNGGTQAIANATGLAGGAGNDSITHADKTLTASASSDSHSTAVTVTLVGLAAGSAASAATANATGIDGGAGVDAIVVDGKLVSNATATGTGAAISVSSLGAVSGAFDAATRAESVAIGVAGGDEADTISLTNKSTTTLTSNASTKDTRVAVTLAIVGIADSQAVSTARATGVAGGAGNDTIGHDGTTTATLTAESKSRAVTVNVVAGAALGDASGRSQVIGSGIDGGQGDDTVVNSGKVELTGTSTAQGNAFSFTGIGVADADAVSASTTSIAGLQGGDGTDTVVNAIGGNVNADATAQTFASSKSFTLAVAGRSDTQATPTATATGLDGGAGDDLVVNDATVTADAHATSSATGWSINFIGGTSTTAGTQATASAFGLYGGLGSDRVFNRSLVTATGLSEASVSGSSWTLGGAATTSTIFSAGGLAAGIAGGAGADQLHNDIGGSLSVFFTSKLTATGDGSAIFGGAKENTQLTASGGAIGIAGEADDDVIQNSGFINVQAKADVTATKAVVSFAGTPTSTALLSAHATATGLGGGAGNDGIFNDGDILVRATGISKLSGGVDAKLVGSPRTSGAGTANATATGLDGGDGVNDVTNAGLVDVSAFGNSETSHSASSGLVFNLGGVPSARSNALSTVNAFGIAAGAGNNTIDNDADLKVTANASGYSYAYASGAHIAVKGAATATADVTATAIAKGISTLGGPNTIVNRGLLSVLGLAGTARLEDADTFDEFCSTTVGNSEEPVLDEDGNQVLDENGNPIFQSTEGTPTCVTTPKTATKGLPTYAAANGNGLDGVGRATSTATTQADAFGVQVGDGANSIVNMSGGEVTVTARPNASVTAFADGDLKAQAFGTGTATARATAVGIQAGDGQNTIVNVGTLTVLAEPTARVSIDVTTAATICIDFFFGTWCGGGGLGFADATATLNATAVGINVGDGDNVVVNDGLLSVTAAPTPGTAISIAHADRTTRSTTVTASAIGIQTGTGNNTIVNTEQGVIDVEAKYTPSCTGTCHLTLTAVGIQTGSGNDTVVNDGVITSNEVSSGGTALSTAIDAGAGNDRVVLGSGSQTFGNVLLGSGNDRLVWGAGASITGTVNPGEGTDTFALGGNVAGLLNLSSSGPIAGMNVFTAFQDFRKEGTSRWTLTGSRAMDWTVEDGTLAIGGSLTGAISTQGTNLFSPTVAVNATGLVTSLSSKPAVTLQTNGVLVNDGQIAGITGVALSGLNGLVINNGSIVASGVGVLSSGSQNVIVNEGLISAGGTGVALASGDVLANSGTITSATGLAVQGGNGIQAVTNSGVLTGGAGLAVDLGAGDDELTVEGNSLINGVSHGGAGTDTLVLGGTTGTLDASTIAAAFTSFENIVMQASLWTVVGDADLDVTVGWGVLNVTSNITGTAATGQGDGALIFVGSSGSLTGDDKPAVVLDGPNTLVNAGTVDGSIDAPGTGSAILNVGVIVNQNGTAITGGAGAQQVENHGVVASGSGTAIDLGAGDDTLSLGPSARLGGSANGGTGFDTLNLTGAGGAQVDLASFDAFERLHKEGDGLWMLTGSSSMAWNVRAGTLVLNGTLTGAGSVEPGGLFAGNARVGSLTNAGTVSPGMSIGAIRVGGDYTQTSTGVLEIEGSIFTDFGDRLNVAGRATLGGTLSLVPESRRFGIATEYTILDAKGGVEGTFAATTSGADHLDAYVDYLPTSVTVAFVRNDISFADMAGTADLQGFSGVLDASKRSMARGDFKAVMDEFVTMDAPAQESALRTLSGEMHASLPTTLLRTGERFFSASATRRVSAQEAGERVTMWTDYLRFSGDLRGIGSASGTSYGVSGFVGGVDFAIGRAARLGGSFGFARARSGLDSFASDGATVRSRMPAVYGQYASGPVLVEGSFGYGEHSVRTARLIEVGAIHRQARADYTADQYSGLMRVSVAVPVRSALALAPFVEMRHSQITRRGFDETGAGSVNLTGAGAFEARSLRTLAGFRTTSASRLFGARVEPSLSLAWTHEGMDRRSGMRAALAGMTTRPDFQMFTLNGMPDSRHGAVIDAGASVVLASHGRAFVAYDGLLTDARTEHSLAAGLRVVW